LRARVNERGQVLQVNVINSSGYPDLDQAAQKTVQTWSFLPATKGGQPIASWVNVPITFSLQ
jgi:protein TonB